MAKKRVEIVIEGVTKGFHSALDKASASLKKFGMYAGTAAVAGVGALATATMKAVSSTKEYALQIDRMAKTTGIATDQLQKFAYAALQEHTSIDTLEKGLAILSKNMYEAAQGSAEYAEVFNDIGISVTDASGKLKNTGDVILELADYMAKETDETKKAAVAKTLLGRSGAEMVPFLEMGREEIAKLGQEAEKLGIVLTENNVKAFKEYQDSVDRMKQAFAGLKMQIATSVLPAFDDVVDSLTEMFRKFRESGALDRMFSGLGEILSSMIPTIEKIVEGFAGIIEDIGPAVTEIFSKMGEVLGRVVQKVVDSGLLETLSEIAVTLADDILEVIEDILPPLTDILSIFLKLVAPIIDLASNLGVIQGIIYAVVAQKVVGALSSMASSFVSMAGTSGTVAANIGTLASKVGLYAAAVAGAIPLAQKLGEELEAHNKNLEQMDEQLDEITKDWTEIGLEAQKARLEELKAAYQAVCRSMGESSMEAQYLRDQIAELEAGLGTNIDVAREWQEAFTRSVLDMVEVGSTGFDSLLEKAEEYGKEMAEGTSELHAVIIGQYKSHNEKLHALAAEGIKGFVDAKISTWREIGPQAMEDIKNQIYQIIENPEEWSSKGAAGIIDFVEGLRKQYGFEEAKVRDLTRWLLQILDVSDEAYSKGRTIGSLFSSGIISSIAASFSRWGGIDLSSKVRVSNRHEGGLIEAHSGLLAPDEVLIKAQKGEFVMSRQAVREYGVDFMKAINERKLGNVTNKTQNIYVYQNIADSIDLERALTELAWRIA